MGYFIGVGISYLYAACNLFVNGHLSFKPKVQ